MALQRCGGAAAGSREERVSSGYHPHARVFADDTWVFTSELYLEVNAGLVVTPEGGVLIDTLPFPSETRQIIAFASASLP